MKRIFSFLLLTLFCIGLTIAVTGPGLSEADETETVKHLQRRIPELREYYDIPGAGAALISEGEVVWTGYFGQANREEDRSVTEDTLFRAESITKTLTAWTIMSLVEQGKLALGDPVIDYLDRWQLPDTEYDESEVTIRGLLSHSSGLTGGTDYIVPGEERPPLEAVLSGEHGLHEARLVREPGTKFEYSNQAFIILQMVVEEILDRDYEEYLQEEVLQPLDVTGYFTVDQEVRDRLATSYYADGEPVRHYVDVAKGHAGLLITAEELAEFFTAPMSETETGESGEGVISPESLETMYTPVIEPGGFYALGAKAVGLGHFIDYPAEEEKAVFHSGEGTGSLGQAYIFPERGEGLVLLTNSEGGWPFLLATLTEWSSSADLPRPSMASFFSYMVTGVNIVTILVVIAVVIKAGFLLKSLIRRESTFAPLSRNNRISRALQVLSAPLIMLLWWYLGEIMLNYFLPIRYNRLGIALAFLSGALLISSLFPEGKKTTK